MAPPPKYETKTIPTRPTPAPPPMALPALVQQVARHEDVTQRAYLSYTFHEETHIAEAPGADGRDGEFSISGDVYSKPSGERYERISKHPVNTLQRATFPPEERQALARLPMFILTTAQLPNYDIAYEGDEKLDEIHTYILRVQPKQLERGTKRFDGVVWVDDRDLAVVKSYGRFVSDLIAEPSLDNPFTDFEIYRENVTSSYWFPTYIRSDSVLPVKDGEIHLRLVIRSSNFQPLSAAPADAPATAAPPGAAGAPSGGGPGTSSPAPTTNPGTPPAKP
jgi:hypothetical protein